jgi:hypothetical protein
MQLEKIKYALKTSINPHIFQRFLAVLSKAKGTKRHQACKMLEVLGTCLGAKKYMYDIIL